MVKIAIQNKGRLKIPSEQFLRSKGLKFKSKGRNLICKCINSGVEFLYVRNSDIPVYVERNVADFGIVGKNVLLEKNPNLKIVRELDFGKCSMVVAVPKNSSIKTIKDLENERIATSYPNILKSFLNKNKINASIIEIKGSCEIAPRLNLADAICDITQTGTTLKENGLTIIAKIFDSKAVIVKCPMSTLKWRDFENSLIPRK